MPSDYDALTVYLEKKEEEKRSLSRLREQVTSLENLATMSTQTRETRRDTALSLADKFKARVVDYSSEQVR